MTLSIEHSIVYYCYGIVIDTIINDDIDIDIDFEFLSSPIKSDRTVGIVAHRTVLCYMAFRSYKLNLKYLYNRCSNNTYITIHSFSVNDRSHEGDDG